MRELVRASQYVMTLHAQDAMEDDDLTSFGRGAVLFEG